VHFIVSRGGWLVAGVLTLALVASLGRVVFGGPLDPSGPPASTLRSLGELPPSWHQNLSSTGTDACHTERFECVLGGDAVLDRETGIVWERAVTGAAQTWPDAFKTCTERGTGGGAGWRLPEIDELLTLWALGQSSPALPAGHPFDLGAVASQSVWSATPDWSVAGRSFIWVLSNGQHGVFTHNIPTFYWCVRGAGSVRG
jgi:hypothetical protein